MLAFADWMTSWSGLSPGWSSLCMSHTHTAFVLKRKREKCDVRAKINLIWRLAKNTQIFNNDSVTDESSKKGYPKKANYLT
jgi:hypothetical protein